MDILGCDNGMQCEKKNNKIVDKIISSLLTLFTIKFTDATPKKRRYLLYYAIEIITEQINTNIDVLPDKTVIQNVTNSINTIYKQIKKNEESPNADYLFNNLDTKNNFERSMRQLDMLNSVDTMNTTNVNMEIKENIEDDNK